MFDHLLESSHRDNSIKWSNIGFGQETKELAAIEIYLRILSGALTLLTHSILVPTIGVGKNML